MGGLQLLTLPGLFFERDWKLQELDRVIDLVNLLLLLAVKRVMVDGVFNQNLSSVRTAS